MLVIKPDDENLLDSEEKKMVCCDLSMTDEIFAVLLEVVACFDFGPAVDINTVVSLMHISFLKNQKDY